ncbi:hypothetical protein SAMN02799630_02245 [Paenibacillus sp. UNCCL117]|nr:hypothetical protein SAMN04488602_106121 [Paenibacillus sp. cl123]SFW34353.1 hypothetical protein SAMN02799630_02245 [Paenibacillus sp. UNCCL117]
MKWGFRLIGLILICGLLSGCSLWKEVNTSLDYVNEATTYVERIKTFSEQVPAMAREAATDPAVRQNLLSEIEALKTAIVQFNGIEAPAFARDVHKQLVGYNETLLKEVNIFFEGIKNNTGIDLSKLADSPLMQTMNQITETLTRIQQLGG